MTGHCRFCLSVIGIRLLKRTRWVDNGMHTDATSGKPGFLNYRFTFVIDGEVYIPRHIGKHSLLDHP